METTNVSYSYFTNRKNLVYTILSGFFITNAIVGEFIGGKIIRIFEVPMSVGIIPWPFIFLLTDVINEHFGKSGVRKLSIITAILIGYAYFILLITIGVPTAEDISPVDHESFKKVFSTSAWIIVGSITAFLVSQLLDATLFWIIKNFTKGKYIWARATGSTIISQFIDSFIVSFIAFVIPAKMNIPTWIALSSSNYSIKLLIAILLTPFIYLVHYVVKWYLKDSEKI